MSEAASPAGEGIARYRHALIRRLARFPSLRPALIRWEENAHFAPIIRRERAELAGARADWNRKPPPQEPLVSVVIPTWNRGKLVAERTIPTVLEQTYQNFEVLVVGDCCTDESEDVLGSFPDPRVRFINLRTRGAYPTEPYLRYCVAGAAPTNEGFRLAQGHWLAQLDDDDTWSPDHIEVLLRTAQKRDLELTYGIIRRERTPGDWVERGDGDFGNYVCLPSSTLLRRYLRLFKVDMDAWRVVWGGDKHRWRRMHACGVRVGFVPQVVAYSPLRPDQQSIAHRAEDREALGPVRKLESVLDIL